MKWKLCFFTVLLSFILAGCEANPQNLPDDKVNNEQPSKEPDAESITSTLEPSVDEKQIITAPVHFMNFTPGSIDPGPDDFEKGYIHIDGACSNSYSQTASLVVSNYDADMESEELYAFIVELGNNENGNPDDYPQIKKRETNEEFCYRKQEYLAEKIEEILEGTNLYLVKDYPYTLIQALYAGPWAVYSPQEGKYIKPTVSEYGMGGVSEYGTGVCVVGRIKDFVALCENGKAINGWYCRFISAARPDIVDVMNEAVENGNATYSDEFWGFTSESYGLTPYKEHTEVTITVDLIK